jgi:hypothetical protein
MTPDAPRPTPRTAPDLAPAEADVARWFAALPRSTVRRDLPDVAVPLVAARPARPAFALRSLGAAAAVLLALVLPAQGRVTASHDCCVASNPDANVAVAVVDDPSVPMLHGLETFDQLACLTAPEGGMGR